MELIQTQVQQLALHQLQSLELLQLSTLELEAYIRELAMENPLVDPEEPAPLPAAEQTSDIQQKLNWLEANGRQDGHYQPPVEEELDPLARAATTGGLEETLVRFLARQIQRLDLDEDTAQIVSYLAACLDDNGYLRISLRELSDESGVPLAKLEEGKAILQTLEPAGVGAEDLSRCLALQLRRLGKTGPVLDIAGGHLEALARRHYREIAGKLGITVEDVLAAERLIQELEPRPGSIFAQTGSVPYVIADVFVENEEDRLVVRTRQRERPYFRINSYYRSLLTQSEDREVKDYLGAKLHQAERVLSSIGQRETTLQRCAQVIAERQADFFLRGAQVLQPLRIADVAQALELHESTISRAVREKYLQCARGVYPLSYFFTHAATADESGAAVGAMAARALLCQLIDGEDKAHPLSDQKLCERMKEADCPIARRTVAKYREEMNIPSAFDRKRR